MNMDREELIGQLKEYEKWSVPAVWIADYILNLTATLRSDLSESQALNTAQAKKIAELKSSRDNAIIASSLLEKENARLKELVENLADHLMFVLPMAKGYAYSNNVGKNVEMVVNAVAALSKIA